MAINGRAHAKISFGERNDLAFECEQNSGDAHRENHDAGDAADGEMATEN
jgi:hypothetical protein